MNSKTTAHSNAALRTVLGTAAQDCAALLERHSPPGSDSAAARSDFWKEHQEDLALLAARATDAASPLLPTQDVHAWIVIASAIHELIEAVCIGGDPAAQPAERRPRSDAAADGKRRNVEADLERVVDAAMSELANLGIVIRQDGEPQKTPCHGDGDRAVLAWTVPGWQPKRAVGRGQLPVGASHHERLAAGEDNVSFG
jgi:hypothetical protein